MSKGLSGNPVQGPEHNKVLRWAAPIALTAMAALLGLAFHNYAFDDPFITYRVASNLAHGNGMVYNAGERVNALTSPLHGMLLAGLHLVTGLDFPALGAAVSMIGLLAAAIILWRILRDDDSPAFPAAALFLCQPLLIQSMGMETGLLLALGLAALHAYSRERLTITGLLLGLAILTRPDAALLAAIIAAHFVLTRKKFPPLASALAVAGALVPWLIFSQLYFGELLPHTLAVKQAQSAVAGQWGGPWMFGRTLLRTIVNFVGELDLTGLLALACVVAGVVSLVKRKECAGRMPAPLINSGEITALQNPILILVVWGALHGLVYALALRVPPYVWYFAPVVMALAVVAGLGAARLAEFSGRGWKLFGGAAAGGLVFWGITTLAGSRMGQGSSPLHAGHALGYAALAAAALAGRARKKIPLARAVPALTAIILIGAFLPRLWNGFLPMTHLPTTQQLYYESAARWIKTSRPGVQSVGAHEIGVLGYQLLDRIIIDQCGIPTPGAAEKLGEGDFSWWVRKYRPEVLVLHADREWWKAVEGPLLGEPWFGAAYSRAQTIAGLEAGPAAGPGGRRGKHAVEIWELTGPEAIPRP